MTEVINWNVNWNDIEYNMLVDQVLDDGEPREDRTGTGTHAIFGSKLEFNLKDGFPMLTTKKVHFKSIVTELLWFIRGETNIAFLKEHGCSIWDEWQRAYSLNRPLILVNKKTGVKAPYTGNFSYDGCNFKADSIDNKLASAWVHMMRRCYDPMHHRYNTYGAAGSTVHPDWHNPETFVTEVKKIPHWFYKAQNWNNFELDKDYYGANEYGLTTTVWLSSEENNKYTKIAIPIQITDNEGRSNIYLTLNDASEGISIPSSTLSRFINTPPKILKGNNKKFIGWSFEKLSTPSDKVLRKELINEQDLGPVYGKQWRSFPKPDGEAVDQLADVIEGLRTNPTSRRHLVVAWNPGQLDQMALPPCHVLFQFYLNNGNELSCQIYQRSVDVGLGLPFNIASYALLTHLVAKELGAGVDKLIHIGGDVHIYDNHREALMGQIERTSFPAPTLRINSSSMFTALPNEIVLENYEAHAKVPMDVAV